MIHHRAALLLRPATLLLEPARSASTAKRAIASLEAAGGACCCQQPTPHLAAACQPPPVGRRPPAARNALAAFCSNCGLRSQRACICFTHGPFNAGLVQPSLECSCTQLQEQLAATVVDAERCSAALQACQAGLANNAQLLADTQGKPSSTGDEPQDARSSAEASTFNAAALKALQAAVRPRQPQLDALWANSAAEELQGLAETQAQLVKRLDSCQRAVGAAAAEVGAAVDWVLCCISHRDAPAAMLAHDRCLGCSLAHHNSLSPSLQPNPNSPSACACDCGLLSSACCAADEVRWVPARLPAAPCPLSFTVHVHVSFCMAACYSGAGRLWPPMALLS